jgi:hypothetical protein
MDGGNGRIIKMDASSGTVGGTPIYGPFEGLAEYETVSGVTQTDLITSGFTEGAGIDVIDNYIIVSDFSNGDIIIYNHQSSGTTEAGRISTGSAGVAGVVIGPEGKIWYVNKTTNEIIKIEPSEVIANVEESIELNPTFSVSPNPASKFVNVFTNGEWNSSKQIQLVDLSGKLINQETFISSSYELQVNDLAKGVYLVHVSDNESTQVQKLVIK